MKNGVSIQLSWWESLLDLFMINTLSLIGFAIIAVIIFWVIKKASSRVSKPKLVLSSLALFYYLLLALTNVFGIPSLGSLSRVYQLGEPIFNPNIVLVPFADGFSLSFILNIIAFVPIGFLVPMISPIFNNIKKMFLLGTLVSLTIEISQLFTLYRATDINDFLTNVLGTLIGYYCFTFVNNLFLKEKRTIGKGTNDQTKYLPPVIFIVSFFTVFLLN
ncbi:VanZ family protein [Vagococcus elongatus]|uniref:VanZ-like domain-containing protein n=1 Tax=Vagococcus elongatus TaxID=180344 RepID=A0A430ASM5_9ENTE|nr:VanZ family protein [Vagococcus elongatus]RSU11053.1 hypothetical protein CBF29_08815 [Vagococcus elongatus]